MPSVDRDRLLLAKIAWSERYDSIDRGDNPQGGHAYLRGRIGHESFNFRPAPDGHYYGDWPQRGRLKLGRIDPGCQGTLVSRVTVIWAAKAPDTHLQVVGWYRNATVFESTRTEDGPWTHESLIDATNASGRCHYMARAPVEGSVRLPLEVRGAWNLPESVTSRMRSTAILHPHVDERSGQRAPWVNQIERLVEKLEGYGP